MAYTHCVPARVTQILHRMDNHVEGTLDIEGQTVTFKTRGHIVKATNRLYRSNSWKPKLGSEVLIDGEMAANGSSLLVDHIEADLLPVGQANAQALHPLLKDIEQLLPDHPPASSTTRLWRRTTPWRLRFTPNFKRRGPQGTWLETIVHAMHDPITGAWTVWSTCKDSGAYIEDGDIDRVLAQSLGMDVPAYPTEPARYKARPAPTAPWVDTSVPF